MLLTFLLHGQVNRTLKNVCHSKIRINTNFVMEFDERTKLYEIYLFLRDPHSSPFLAFLVWRGRKKFSTYFLRLSSSSSMASLL